MPGTTAYPAALDTFPEIGPNTKEDVVSHSGAHNNEAAAIAALQVKVGIDDSADADSLDARVAAVEEAVDAVPDTSDDLTEGTTNLYFTDARAYAAVKASLQAGTHTGVSFAFDDGAMSISLTASGGGDAADVAYDNTTSGLTADDVQAAIDEIAGGVQGAIGCTFDGGGSVIATGAFVDVPVPFDCVIKAATLFGDPSGSLVVSVWACAAADYPPVAGDNIAGTAPPTLSSEVYSRDSTLTGWTVALAKGSVVRFKVQSRALVTRASLALEVIKL